MSVLKEKEVGLELDMYRNKFVVAIEGGEGTGKSTLVKELKKRLPNVCFAYEPGFGSIKAQEIRRHILIEDYSDRELAILFAMARNEIRSGIPEDADFVITDRSIISSMVYQGGINKVMDVNRHYVQGLRLPDMVFLLTGDIGRIYNRMVETRDDISSNPFDRQPLEYHQQIDARYKEVIKQLYGETNHYYLLDNTDLDYSLNPDFIISTIERTRIQFPNRD